MLFHNKTNRAVYEIRQKSSFEQSNLFFEIFCIVTSIYKLFRIHMLFDMAPSKSDIRLPDLTNLTTSNVN